MKQYETIQMSSPAIEKLTEFRDWLHAHVYRNQQLEEEFHKASRVLRELFDYFVAHPNQLSEYGAEVSFQGPIESRVADFLAGMTDRYAMALYQKLFFPRPWRLF